MMKKTSADNNMKMNEDALEYLINTNKRKKKRRRIGMIIVLSLLLLFLLLKLTVGIAWYTTNEANANDQEKAFIIYSKLPAYTGHYEQEDLLIFRETTEHRIYMKTAEEFKNNWETDRNRQVKIIGKIIWSNSRGGSVE